MPPRLLAALLSLVLLPAGRALTFMAYNPAGADYVRAAYAPLVSRLQALSGLNLTLLPAGSDAEAYAAMDAGQADFMSLGPTLYVCLQAEFNVTAMATIVQLDGGVETAQVAGVAVVASSSQLQNLTQVVGRRVAVGQLSAVTSLLAQLFTLLGRGVNLFAEASAILFAGSSDNTLNAVLYGLAEVGFVRSGTLEASNDTAFQQQLRYLDAHPVAGFPHVVSTDLYPSGVVAASPAALRADSIALGAALLEMQGDPSLALLSFAGFAPPSNYFPLAADLYYAGILRSVGDVVGQAACIRDTGLAAFYDEVLECPAGTVKAPGESAAHCLTEVGLGCPQQFECVCSPCVPVRVARTITLPLALGVPGAALAIALLCFYAYLLTHNRSLGGILWDDLHIGEEVLGCSALGLVLRGSWKGNSVALKRLWMPDRGSSPSVSPFDMPIPGGRVFRAPRTSKRSALLSCLLARPTAGQRLAQEVQHAVALHHDCLVPVLGLVDRGGPHRCTLLVSAHQRGGTLRDMLANRTVHMERALMLCVMRDMCEGLLYLHSLERYGSKLASEHVLFGSSMRCKLQLVLGPQRALRQYVSPEVLHSGRDTPEGDVFAFGLAMFEILYKVSPVESVHAMSEDWKLPAQSPAPDVADLHDLMQQCLSPAPAQRPTLDGLHASLVTLSGGFSFADAMLLDSKRLRPLLQQRLPVQVMNAIKADKRKHEQAFPCVSVFVARVLEDNEMLSTMSFAEVRSFKDSLFGRLDTIALQYNLFRLQTTDSSYVVAGNMFTPDDEHALQAIRFGAEAMAAADSIGVSTSTGERRTVQLRAGLHCSPMVSMVLGFAVPRYCLLGPAMTVANALEQTSEGGLVQVTQQVVQAAAATDPNLMERLRGRERPQLVPGRGYFRTYTYAAQTSSDSQSAQNQ